jgi:hypothetical protein
MAGSTRAASRKMSNQAEQILAIIQVVGKRVFPVSQHELDE